MSVELDPREARAVREAKRAEKAERRRKKKHDKWKQSVKKSVSNEFDESRMSDLFDSANDSQRESIIARTSSIQIKTAAERERDRSLSEHHHSGSSHVPSIEDDGWTENKRKIQRRGEDYTFLDGRSAIQIALKRKRERMELTDEAEKQTNDSSLIDGDQGMSVEREAEEEEPPKKRKRVRKSSKKRKIEMRRRLEAEAAEEAKFYSVGESDIVLTVHSNGQRRDQLHLDHSGISRSGRAEKFSDVLQRFIAEQTTVMGSDSGSGSGSRSSSSSTNESTSDSNSEVFQNDMKDLINGDLSRLCGLKVTGIPESFVIGQTEWMIAYRLFGEFVKLSNAESEETPVLMDFESIQDSDKQVIIDALKSIGIIDLKLSRFQSEILRNPHQSDFLSSLQFSGDFHCFIQFNDVKNCLKGWDYLKHHTPHSTLSNLSVKVVQQSSHKIESWVGGFGGMIKPPKESHIVVPSKHHGHSSKPSTILLLINVDCNTNLNVIRKRMSEVLSSEEDDPMKAAKKVVCEYQQCCDAHGYSDSQAYVRFISADMARKFHDSCDTSPLRRLVCEEDSDDGSDQDRWCEINGRLVNVVVLSHLNRIPSLKKIIRLRSKKKEIRMEQTHLDNDNDDPTIVESNGDIKTQSTMKTKKKNDRRTQYDTVSKEWKNRNDRSISLFNLSDKITELDIKNMIDSCVDHNRDDHQRKKSIVEDVRVIYHNENKLPPYAMTVLCHKMYITDVLSKLNNRTLNGRSIYAVKTKSSAKRNIREHLRGKTHFLSLSNLPSKTNIDELSLFINERFQRKPEWITEELGNHGYRIGVFTVKFEYMKHSGYVLDQIMGIKYGRSKKTRFKGRMIYANFMDESQFDDDGSRYLIKSSEEESDQQSTSVSNPQKDGTKSIIDTQKIDQARSLFLSSLF